MNEYAIRALETKQLDNTLYSFFIPAKDILSFADISRIHRDEKGKLQGLQRKEVKKHVNDILEYLNSNEVLFPNSILLAINDEVKFTKIRGTKLESDKYSTSGTLVIPIKEEGFRPAWIVDGQQRVLALSKCNKPELPIPIIAFIADDLEMQREQFIRVNKTKPLPKGLIDELLPTVTSILPVDLDSRRIPSRITEYLNFDPKSPFYGLIQKVSIESDENFKPVIAHNSIMNILKNSINNTSGCLFPYVNTNDNEIDYESILKVIYTYWGCVKKVFHEDWGKPPNQSRLMHGTGIFAIGALMDNIMIHINPNDKKIEGRVTKELTKLKPYCRWSSGTWDELQLEWNEVQNIAKHKKMLVSYLVRQFHKGI
ncbi:MAG: DGQHR domain-containing protein DpdB [bacterium]